MQKAAGLAELAGWRSSRANAWHGGVIWLMGASVFRELGLIVERWRTSEFESKLVSASGCSAFGGRPNVPLQLRTGCGVAGVSP
jgi:hypothetical protein